MELGLKGNAVAVTGGNVMCMAADASQAAEMENSVGPDAGVLVDCHWRFDEPTALQLLRDMAPLKLFWAECLTSERAELHPVLDRARRAAADMGVLVAGGERQVGLLGFEPLLCAKLTDVVMPDIKYTGGYSGMLAVAKRAHPAVKPRGGSIMHPRLG